MATTLAQMEVSSGLEASREPMSMPTMLLIAETALLLASRFMTLARS